MNSHMKMNIDLTGRTALVCGASSGIGAATARLLAGQGARVIALARREEALRELVKSLPQVKSGAHRALASDVNDRTRLRSEVAAELKNSPTGAIEILVNNSSGPKGGPITEATEEAFLNTFSQHLLANQALVQTLLPGMRAEGYGRIVNIISTSVKIPIPNLGVSNTIRWAVASWAKTLSLEVASSGITVNSVLPGYTDTERLSELLKGAAAARGITAEQVATEWKNATPMRRFGSPEEVASAVVFLASPAAAFITGTAIPVDGGRTGCL